MKVLMLGWELPPLITGGLGTACHGLLTALEQEGNDVVFIMPWSVQGMSYGSAQVIGAFGNVHPGSLSDYIGIRALKSYTYGSGAQFYGIDIREEVDRFAESAAGIAMEQTFDVIHAHDWTTVRAGVLLKELFDKPLVMHFHSIERDRTLGDTNPQVCVLEQEGILAADRVIAVSIYTRQQIVENYRVDYGKLQVIHNGIAPVDTLSPRYRLSERWPRTALFVGRLTAQKGPQYFLLAAEKVLRSAPDTRFIVVGEGDMRGYLEEMAKELQISEKVIFTGFVSQFDLDRIYSLASVCVLTSVSEPFGLVALEAMRRGIPVIVPRSAGVAEIVHHCIRIDYWDVDAIAGSILGVITDRDFSVDEMVKNAAQEAEKLSWRRAAEKLIGVYQELTI